VAIYEGYGMSRRKRSRSDQDGASAVEFALIVPIFAAIVFGIIEFGWYFWTAETTSSAAREAARRVVVGDCWDQDQLMDFAGGQALQLIEDGTQPPPLSADPATLNVGDPITVTLESKSSIINFFDFVIPARVTREYEARMEDTEGSGTCG
jgi:hypothetical protein